MRRPDVPSLRSTHALASLAFGLLCLAASPAIAAEPPLAFPGAQGWAAHATGGRGGRIIRVTTLAADGPGSFAEAVAARGPRIVVFEVGGVIDLGVKTIKITEGDLTIAGQTAPQPGITFIRGGFDVHASNVVIRHIRVRPGDAGQPKMSGGDFDAISTDIVLDTGASLNTQCDNEVDGSRAVVFEFRTFRIRAGRTVKLVGRNPAIILVSGDVLIESGGRLLVKSDGTAGTPSANGLNGTGGAGTNPVEAAGGRVATHADAHLLGEGFLFASGLIERVTDYETGLVGHHTFRGDKGEADPLILDERFVAARVRGRGVTVLSACSHAGPCTGGRIFGAASNRATSIRSARSPFQKAMASRRASLASISLAALIGASTSSMIRVERSASVGVSAARPSTAWASLASRRTKSNSSCCLMRSSTCWASCSRPAPISILARYS